jgi:hypothetical protein
VITQQYRLDKLDIFRQSPESGMLDIKVLAAKAPAGGSLAVSRLQTARPQRLGGVGRRRRLPWLIDAESS